MKAGIHPKYEVAQITCACGRVTETRSTVGEIHVEICSHCHPYFTGRQKLVDTAGRVERFKAKYGSTVTERAGSTARAAETDTDDAAEPVADAEEPTAESVELEATAEEDGDDEKTDE